MKTKTLFFGLTLTTMLALSAAWSLAATTPAASGNQPMATPAAAQWLSIGQVYRQLESAGYRNIEKIERERGNYEVKATHRDGQRVKLYVHPQTGAILDMRQRKDKHEEQDSNWGWSHGGTGKSGVECNQRRCRDDLPSGGGRP